MPPLPWTREIPEHPATYAEVRSRASGEEIQVAVPAGISDGEMIRMPGRGEALPGAGAGASVCEDPRKTDRNFVRDGNNLLTSLHIKLTDALLAAITVFAH